MSIIVREPHTGQMCFRCVHHPTIMILPKETKRPDWCPLKPMPEKANHPDLCDGGRYDKGYNACIDELLKTE